MKSLGRLLASTKVLWPLYFAVSVCAVLIAATGLITPFLIKAATDAVVSVVGDQAEVSTVVRTVSLLALALLAVEMTNSVVQNLGGYFGDLMAYRMRHILSSQYYAKLLSLPQKYFDDEVTGTIISRLSRSLMETTQFLNSFSNNFFSMLLTVVAVLVISAFYYWPLALLLFIIFPLYTWLTTLTSKKWQKWEGEKNEHVDAANGRFAEVVGQIRVVKSFAQERRELSLFTRRYGQIVGITNRQSRYWHWMDVARQTVLNVVFFAIYLIVFIRTAQGHFSVGDMVLLIQLVTMARWPVTMMSYLVDTSQRAIAGSKQYFAVMQLPPGPGEPALDPWRVLAQEDHLAGPAHSGDDACPPGEKLLAGRALAGRALAGEALERSDACAEAAVNGTAASTAKADALADRLVPVDPIEDGQVVVRFDHVSFAYPDSETASAGEQPSLGPQVLTDISFALHKGERVALVSESGGGKTTLVSLLLGFYRPTGGTISIADRDVAQLPLVQLRRQVGVVFQEASLFSGTIAENIAYARPEADQAQIEQVARRANAHGFISRFAQGYDSTIGERGLKLSGGQKQRIAVARAMLKDAPILVLDEATSALDTKAERAVQEGLSELMAGRTSLIIAHRLSTISAVDTIITLREGRVDEMGSPAQLAGTDGIYAELLALQASATQADRKRLRDFGIVG